MTDDKAERPRGVFEWVMSIILFALLLTVPPFIYPVLMIYALFT